MSEALTKSEIIAGIAESPGIDKKQTSAAFDALIQLAYRGAATRT